MSWDVWFDSWFVCVYFGFASEAVCFVVVVIWLCNSFNTFKSVSLNYIVMAGY